MLGTVPSSRAVPGKVALTIPHFQHLTFSHDNLLSTPLTGTVPPVLLAVRRFFRASCVVIFFDTDQYRTVITHTELLVQHPPVFAEIKPMTARRDA